MPMTSQQAFPSGTMSPAIFACSCSDSTVGGMPPSTLTMKLYCTGALSSPMSKSGQVPWVWPVSKHSSSGFTPARFIASSSLEIFAYLFWKTMSKTNFFRRREYFE